MKTRQPLVKQSQFALTNLRWCDSFISKLRGFTFKPKPNSFEAIVLVEQHDTRVNASIHMLFVNFELAVIWINNQGEVVDKVLAKPWRLSYTPKKPARYILEGHPDLLEQIQLGDHVKFTQ